MMTKRTIYTFLVGAVLMVATLEGGSRLAVRAIGVPPLMWHDYGAQLKVEQLSNDKFTHDLDVVVVGTSMAQQGLVPEEIASGATYNASLNGGIPQVMEPWIIEQVLPRAKPDTIIWGLSSLDFSANYGDATVKAYQAARSTEHGPLAALDKKLSEYSTFIANRSTLRNPSALAGQERQTNRQRFQKAHDTLGPRGERQDFTTALSDDLAVEIRDRLSPDSLDLDDLASVARVIEQLDHHGIDVVLVEMPVPPRFVALDPQGAENQQVFTAALQALSNEVGASLISVSEPFSDDEFVDYTHLSAEGAVRFSRLVDARLNSLAG